MVPLKENEKSNNKGVCFVIMPFSEPDGCEECHFKKVYEQIFIPAISAAGFEPRRADDNHSSHFIHASMIKDLIEAPMAICDLSTKNPNVLYELGIRHAFNKPVVLVQEVGTERVFDITGINTVDYRPNRLYDEVLQDRELIERAITETSDDSAGKHSLIKLIQVAAAHYDDEKISGDYKTSVMLDSIMNELRDLKRISYSNSRENSQLEQRKMDNNLNERYPPYVIEAMRDIDRKITRIEHTSADKPLTDIEKDTLNQYMSKIESFLDRRHYLSENTILELSELFNRCKSIIMGVN